MRLEYVNIREESIIYLKIRTKKKYTYQYKPIITIIVINLLGRDYDIHLQKDGSLIYH